MVIILKVLFKNRTKYSEEVYNQFLEFHRNKFKFSYTLYTALIMIALFYFISMQVIYHNLTLAIVLCIVMSVFFLWRYLKPISEVSKDYKSDTIQQQQSFTFLFYSNHFIIRNNMCYESIKYSNLHRIFETNDFFYLYIDKRHSYIISKSGFLKGTSNDFASFIKKKNFFKYKQIHE